VVLQLSSKITYPLWVDNGRDGVSKWFCSYPARSRTVYGQATGEAELEDGRVAIQQDHILPVSERSERRVSRWVCGYSVRSHTTCVRGWERRSQRVVLQLSSKITYPLVPLCPCNGRDSVSKRFCSYPAR
jgi:hypothetical protein